MSSELGKPRVLIIDDEPDFVRLLSDNLVREGFHVSVAEDGIKGLKVACESQPDVILLDWNLPGKDGLDVCKTLKADEKTRSIPVIMLTVRGREADVVVGLEMGAEDYVSKRALRPRELVARVRTALRRNDATAQVAPLRSGPVKLDPDKRRCFIEDQLVELRSKEFDLLYVFLKNKGRVLSRSFLEETVWGRERILTSRAIDTTVARLRAKLGKESHRIEGVKGLGYRFEEGA